SGREEHQIIVCGGGKKMLNEIAFFFFGGAFARLHPDNAFSAAPLRAKCAYGGAVNKTPLGGADDSTPTCAEIFHIDLGFVGSNFRQARGVVLVADFAQLFLDDGEDALLFSENVAQIIDRFDELLVFVNDFLALESG